MAGEYGEPWKFEAPWFISRSAKDLPEGSRIDSRNCDWFLLWNGLEKPEDKTSAEYDLQRIAACVNALDGLANVWAVAKVLRHDRPWSLNSILDQLIAEVEHLHRDHSCDHQGYEDALAAKAAAAEVRLALAALDAPAEVKG